MNEFLLTLSMFSVIRSAKIGAPFFTQQKFTVFIYSIYSISLEVGASKSKGSLHRKEYGIFFFTSILMQFFIWYHPIMVPKIDYYLFSPPPPPQGPILIRVWI